MRSPLPKSVPSTRSAPAISPSSAVATAVPRSLCGCTLRTMLSRAETCRWNHSMPVGVDVRRERLDRRRQVDDHLLVAASAPTRRSPPRRSRARSRARCRGSSRASTRRRSPSPSAAASSLQSAVAAHGEVGDPGLVEAEDDAPLRRRRRVVEVHDRARARPRSPRRCARSAPGRACVSTAIVVSSGMQVLLDQPAHEVEVGLRRRREADLDLLDAELRRAGRTCAACAPSPSA